MTLQPKNGIPIADLRRDYSDTPLMEKDVAADPIRQFELWLANALTANLTDPNACTLATASSDGVPSARIVLLKEAGAQGFVFFTNYESQKGKELSKNPRAALVFWWAEIGRQVRVSGTVSKVSREESASYFLTRPEGSKMGAWASPQSRVIANRGELEEQLKAIEERYAGGGVPLPPFWGGYRLIPSTIEFWQGRADRLHDRLRYDLGPSGKWELNASPLSQSSVRPFNASPRNAATIVV